MDDYSPSPTSLPQDDEDQQLSVEERRKLFYEQYAASLTREDWLQMDRDDVENLELGVD